ncbi:MAG TPA: 8-amino-7-oxononanoate synthase [Acidimicrobiales bacterium]|jgi:8-amino-7-oxononanoate synthase|nr:8-amino-7-oxononanoate synthase [Acidimicrobiales bacterium]
MTGWPAGEWAQRVRSQLDRIAEEGRWRAPREFDARGPAGSLADVPQPVVSFAGNDYLGLSGHPAVVAAAHRALDRWGAGSGGSRLITGSRPVHRELEEALASWKGTEAAICYPTGFAANLGVLSVLGGPDALVLSDELNHASIIDGCRLARAEVAVYRHADPEHLASLLAAAGRPAVVVTDTVFSMDGDVAPLAELAAVCRRHGALLVMDEAHSVLGPHPGPEVTGDLPVVRVGTLSKTLGSSGGFVAASRPVVDLLVNASRPYIFTTAGTPADAAAALAALDVLRSPEGVALCTRLADLVDRVAPAHPTPIVPIVLGSEQRALRASAALLARGLWVPAIRPPTVPVGTSRLRLTLSAAHTDGQVDQLLAALVSPEVGAGLAGAR